MCRTVIAIGCFDGVHLGHKYLIQQAINCAKACSLPLFLLTFEPDPALFFKLQKLDCLLMQTSYKLSYLQFQFPEIDMVMTISYDQRVASLRAQDFVVEFLLKQLNMGVLVVGRNFQFGAQRQGNVELLQFMANQYNFQVRAVDLWQLSVPGVVKQVCSSACIRQLIRNGQLQQARQFLGHSWQIQGKVELGKQRKLYYPTANIEISNYVWPKFGVYAAWVIISQVSKLPAVVNFGLAPTFAQDHTPHFAVHVLQSDQNGIPTYGQVLCLELIEFIRPEIRFINRQALEKQIQQDCCQALQLLSHY